MKRKLEITYSYDKNEKGLTECLISALEAHALTTIAEEMISRPELREGELTYYDLDSDNEAEYHGKWEMVMIEVEEIDKSELERSLAYFDYKYKVGDFISFKTASNSSIVHLGHIEYKNQLGLVTIVANKRYELRKLIDIAII